MPRFSGYPTPLACSAARRLRFRGVALACLCLMPGIAGVVVHAQNPSPSQPAGQVTTATAPPAGEPGPPPHRTTLGINVSGVTDYSSELVFLDAFKAARTWISQAEGKAWGQGGPLELDDAGWVKSLKPGQFAETILWTNFADRYPDGAYFCTYEGKGTIEFGGDAKLVSSKPGRINALVKHGQGQATLKVTATDPKDPVRKIRLVPFGALRSASRQPFHPDFLQRWRGFSVFRFMDWQKTNNSPIRNWSDRPKTDMSQAWRGVAPEYLIQLADIQKADPWFCMPHLATDDYVRSFAQLVKDRLPVERKVYLEYSNECWNGQFAQARYCQEQGLAAKLATNPYEAQLRFYSQRSVEIFRIWEREFGGPERIVRVLAAQSANPWTGTTVLSWQDAYKHADAVAVAPYFGHSWGDPRQLAATKALTADELVAKLGDDVEKTAKDINAYAALAREKGLSLLAYEGGQHLVGHGGAENDADLTALFHAANRHPRMKDLYQRNLRDWQSAGGGVFCAFASMSIPSKWGSWGLLEHTKHDPRSAPKYQALQEFQAALTAQTEREGEKDVEPPAVAVATATEPLFLDFAKDAKRQVIVDREPGQYLGHPSTLLLEDGKTILCVYPKGHGRGAILYKRSTDGGKTWSDRLPTPENWAGSRETPTLYRVVDAQGEKGKKRVILFSGLYPCRIASSENDGKDWTPLAPVGDWGGIVAMSSVVPLRNRPGEYLAIFHDDGRYIRKDGKKSEFMTLYTSLSQDGGLTWATPKAIYANDKIHLCEPGAVRSPDGKTLAILLRENRRRKPAHLMTTTDEGATWSAPTELPLALTGDRHVGRYLPDGRLFLSFRDTAAGSPTIGDWVAWVGTFEDIVNRRPGQYRIRLMDNHHQWDCAYPGVELLPDGTIVTTTYGHWTAGQPPYIVSIRITAQELDNAAAALRKP